MNMSFENNIHEDVGKALVALRRGEFVLIYDRDGREEETDLVIASQHIRSRDVHRLRRDGGGLICTTVTHDAAEKLGIPYLSELFSAMSDRFPLLRRMVPDDIPYDEISSFSLTINHRETYTGITDNDRALTVKRFAALLDGMEDMEQEEAQVAAGKEFRAPGHIHLLNCTPNLLSKRQGHTELSTAMVIMAGLTPSATICEMMGDDGNALSKEGARGYAGRNGLLWIEGADVIDAWNLYGQDEL